MHVYGGKPFAITTRGTFKYGMLNSNFHRELLSKELASRIARNNLYSLRAFAKSLEVDPAVISRVLSGARSLSTPVAERISIRLNLKPEKREQFIKSAVTARTGTKKQIALPAKSFDEIDIETFRVISDWYHYAILELTFVKEIQNNPRWIGKVLGISVIQAKLAVHRLLHLGLLEIKNGKLTKTKINITTSNKTVTTPALRQYQKQILEKALHSLENDPIGVRNMTGMTMAISPEKLPEAKVYIEEFMKNMCTLLETGSNRQVYQLGINLYPLQKKMELH